MIKGSHYVERGERKVSETYYVKRGLFRSWKGTSLDKTSSIGAARLGSRENRHTCSERKGVRLLAYPTGTVTSGSFLSNLTPRYRYSSLAWKKRKEKKKKSTVVFSVWNINTEWEEGEKKKKKSSSFAFHEIFFFFRRGLDIRDLADRVCVCSSSSSSSRRSFVLISLKSSLIRSIPRLVALPSPPPPLQTLAHLPRPGGARSRGPLVQINRRRACAVTDPLAVVPVRRRREFFFVFFFFSQGWLRER